MSGVKVTAMIMLEAIGSPSDHVKETLEKISKEISEQEGIKILENKIADPKELEKKKGVFSSFAEIEFEADTIGHIISIVFKYMPSFVEIISPENLTINNKIFGDTFTEIIRRLHKYEELARIFNIQNKALSNRIEELQKQLKQ